ncbi:MAG: S9 family peptidase [Acidobacteriaceae bacterium]|jgi:dipeptidyl aminopeptidase/acylaminoacyl peptidase
MKSLRAVAIVLVSLGALAAQGQVGQTASQTLGPVAAKRPMTFADLMAMKRVSDPQISPSGKWVMFSVMDVSLEKNTKVNHLWVVPINGSAPEKQVTSNTGESFGRFSPDGKFVSYTGAPTKDDPVRRITIATWDEATGTIGVGRTLQAVSGDADGAIWSPDSRHFLFTTQVYPECSNKPTWAEEDACDKAKDDAVAASPVKAQVWDALLYRHWDAYTGLKRTHIIEADFSLAGANPRDLTPASAVGDAETPTWMLGGPLEYAWAPDSKEIAYVTNLDKVPAASTNNDVFTLRLDEPGAKAVKVSTSPGSDDEPEYSPDGKWLAFRSQARAGFESDRFRLMLYDREKKTIKDAIKKWDLWVDEFVWSPDSARLYFASANRGDEPVYETDVSGLIAGQVAGIIQSGEFGDLRISPDGKQLVMSGMRLDMPSTIVSMPVDVPVDSLSILSHLNDPLLSKLEIAPMESFWFAGAEGTKVQGFILRPPGFDAAKKYPVKFVMHGGPQTALGDSWSYRWNWELLATDGYVVVGINRRGSTGYGQKFVDEVSGDWGGRAYEDLMKGLDYAEAAYPFIDKTRECALGASYGGFMADWVLTHTNRFKCIVTHDGMFNPVSAYGSTEELWFNEWEFRRPEDFPKGWDGFTDPTHAQSARVDGAPGSVEGHAAEPWRYQNLPAEQDPFRRWSPMRFIENAKTPTLVIHSQKDYRLDVSQGFELYTALERRGVPAKFLYFPDEGHWVLKPQNSQLWYQAVGDWCDRWTKSGKDREQGTGNR